MKAPYVLITALLIALQNQVVTLDPIEVISHNCMDDGDSMCITNKHQVHATNLQEILSLEKNEESSDDPITL